MICGVVFVEAQSSIEITVSSVTPQDRVIVCLPRLTRRSVDIIVARVSGVPPIDKGQKKSKPGRKLRRMGDLTAGDGANDREQPADFPRIILTDADASYTESSSKATGHATQELQSLSRSLSKLAKHFVITLCVSGLGVLTHLVLVHWFGDPRFFDLVPVRYAIDAGDIAVIATFFIMMIRELWRQK